MSFFEEFFGDPLEQAKRAKERKSNSTPSSQHLKQGFGNFTFWDPNQHSSEENFLWCRLRAIEWGRWPLFLSQPIAPVLLIFLPWQTVALWTFLLNLGWALVVRYHVVSMPLAYWGAVVAQLRWLTWPGATVWLFSIGRTPEAWVSLCWLPIMFALGVLTPVNIGRIQEMFIDSLGFPPTGQAALRSKDARAGRDRI